MKTLTTQVLIAVAALAVAAGSASAQTYNAQIPMSFHVGNKALAAGSYQFLLNSNLDGTPVVTIRNQSATRTVIVIAGPGSDAPKAWRQGGKPVVAFECVAGNCALSRLWNGYSTAALRFPTPKVRPSEVERLTSITVALTKAD